MDVSISIEGERLHNVSYHDGYIQADFSGTLLLRPSDMVGVDIGTSDDGRLGYLSIPLTGTMYLRLVYPIPPLGECHACHVKQYPDGLEYISESMVEQYHTLASHRWYYICKACLGVHIDEQESVLEDTYTGPDGIEYHLCRLTEV